MASAPVLVSETSLQGDLEELKAKVKLWDSLINAAAPRCQRPLSAKELFEQCASIGAILDQMPEYQVRLLALQLTGHLPGLMFKENENYLNELAEVSTQWRDVYMGLSRWHAQVQTAFLKVDGFQSHCNDFEITLRKFGDQIFDLQQFPLGASAFSVNSEKPPEAFKRLEKALSKHTSRMQGFKICLAAMQFGTTSALRREQLDAAEKRLVELEAFLELQRERFWLCAQKLGLGERVDRKRTNSDSKGYSQKTISMSEKESTGTRSLEIPRSNSARPSKAGSVRTLASQKILVPQRRRLPLSHRTVCIGPQTWAFLMGLVPLDFIFLGLLICLVVFWWPSCDRIVFHRFLEGWGLSWTRGWSVPPPL